MRGAMIEFDASQAGPLDGMRVLDLSRLVAGNMLSLQLGDLGAAIRCATGSTTASRCSGRPTRATSARSRSTCASRPGRRRCCGSLRAPMC
jgi:hypothetical protein